MQIYLFDELEQFNYEKIIELLPSERREKLLKYKSPEARNLSAAAYMLLTYAVSDFAGLDTVPEIILNEHGKPYFKGIDDLFFNLSHCKYGVACGVSGEEIGVDIQDVRKVSAGTIQRTMLREEQQIIAESDDPERAFAKLWSRKESYVKLSGEGLSFGLKNVDTINIKNIRTFEYERYFVSVAGNRDAVLSAPKIIKYKDIMKKI